MKISLFEEVAVPRPWTAESESTAFAHRLEEIKLADKIGMHAVWLTEHHFLEEYSHSSAPEVFLGALSTATRNIRLGHGIVHAPPGINHPARTAERVATLDILSGGRVELGTGESSSAAELDGFNIDPGRKREMWREGMEVLIGCLADTPFAGYDGEFVRMPPRNVVPKPVQRPHPPLWVSCTRRATIDMAAENGLGALVFSFYGPEIFEEHLLRYYSLLDRAVPIGRAVNPNVLCSAGALICGPTNEAAARMIGQSARFFSYGIGHYYLKGPHKPGVTELWPAYVAGMQAGTVTGDDDAERRGVGSPAKLRALLRAYEQIGVDQVMFTTPPVAHEDIMESLDRIGREVLPEFIDRDQAASAAKAERMEPVIEAAMARRKPDRQADPDFEFASASVAWDLSPVTDVVESMALREKEREQFRQLRSQGKIEAGE